MSLKDFLNFFRWKNIVMIILMQFLIKYVLFEKFELITALDPLHFGLLNFSTICVAIAGYIINDIYDVKADIINKPDKLFIDKKITRIHAHYLFLGFNSVGMIIGMYLSYYVGHTSYFIIYVLTSLLLYQYAKYLKKKLLIGNLVVSFSVFLSILLVLVFDLFPVTSDYNFSTQFVVYRILLIYGGFSIMMTLVREIVKDCEDIQGDQAMEVKSIPIVYGMKKSKYLIVLLSLLIIVAISRIVVYYFPSFLQVAIYLILAIIVPMIYFIIGAFKAKEKRNFHQLSSVLKFVMLTGVLSLIFV